MTFAKPPVIPPTRYWLPAGLSALVIALAITVAVGWHTHTPRIAQWAPGRSPMVYNTAISLAVLGAALLALSLHRQRLSALLAALGVVPSLLTLVEYAAGVSLGIDELLMKFRGPAEFPGRIPPNSSVCLLLLGAAMLCMQGRARFRWGTLWSPLLVSMAFGIGAVSMAGYLSGYETFGWGRFLPMALPTACGLSLLSLAALSLLWRKSDLSGSGAPSWLYMTVTMAAIVMTLSLWQAVAVDEHVRIQEAVANQLEIVRVSLLSDMEFRLAAMSRFARRWERTGLPNAQLWTFETGMLVNDVQGFQAIGWADPSFRIRWVYPRQGNEALLGADLNTDDTRRTALAAARGQRRTVITHTMRLLAGGTGINAYLPLYRGSVFQGFILVGFRFRDLFPKVVDPTLAPGYGITISDGKEIVYLRAPQDGARDSGWGRQTSLRIENVRWTLKVWPALALAEMSSSRIVLGAGLLLSLLFGLAVYLAEAARSKSRAAELARAELEREVAERGRAEQELDQYFALAPDMLCIAGFDGYFKRVNPAWERILGIPLQCLLGEPLRNFIHPDDWKSTEEAIDDQRAGNMVLSFENRYRAQDGSYRWLRWNSWLVPERQLIFAAARDVTAEKHAEAARQESEAAFRALSDAVPQMVWISTPEGLNVYYNQRWVDYTGLTLEESYGAGWNTPFHPDDKLPAKDAWNHATETGQTYCIESRLRRADGSYRWFLMRSVPLRDASGRIVKWFGTCTEIHGLKLAEETLRKLNEELRQAGAYNRSLIEASLDPLVTIASNGAITDVNQATELATGVSRRALIGADFCDYFTDRERARAGFQRVFQEGWIKDYELELRHRDGSARPVLYNASLYRNDAGVSVGVFAAARDITALKRVEGEIKKLNAGLERRVAERTAELLALNQELESFNYSISHDLRAPLRHIDGFSRILLEEHAAGIPDEARRCLGLIRDGARRMGRMVDELLELSRTSRKEVARQPTGLRSLVDDVLADLRPELEGRRIEWRIGELPFVDCDPTLTRQVFANLLSNAVKFSRPRNPAVIEVGQGQREGQAVLFVRDNGVGFSLKYADKLFGVFQRLHRREDFEGTGVGLATVQRIVLKHGGRIWVEAELNKGASFYFTLEPPGGSVTGVESRGTELVAGGKRC